MWKDLNTERWMKDTLVRQKLQGMQTPLEKAERIISGADVGSPVYTTNFRTESSDTTPKHRLVWAAPLDNLIVEGMIGIPIQEALKANDREQDEAHGHIFMYMREYLQYQSVLDLLSFATRNRYKVISIDYSSYDLTLSPELMRQVGYALVGRSGLGKTIIDRLVTKRLLSPWGVKEISGNMPSGSLFTNLLDSVINAVAIEYIALRIGCYVEYKVNGDDAIAVFAADVDMQVMSDIARELGLNVHPEKQAISNDAAVFNKAYWHVQYGGLVPSAYRTVNSLVHRDSMIEGRGVGPNEEIFRSIQVLQELEYHPYRDKVVKSIAGAAWYIDGYNLLDYRYRVPLSTMIPERDGNKIDIPDYVRDLDNEWMAKIYEYPRY
jgi:hypothetical protein